MQDGTCVSRAGLPGLRAKRIHAIAILALAAAGVWSSKASAQFYNIADLGTQFGAPVSMEGNSGQMLLPDATTGQIYGLNPPIAGLGFTAFPTPTPLNQLAGRNNFSGPNPPFNASTITLPTVFDSGTSQETSVVTGTRIAGSFTGTDGLSHVFEYYNPVLDGKSPPTQGNQTIFSDVGSLSGHTTETLTVTGMDEFDNLTGFAFSPTTGVKTPFAKFTALGDSLQVLTTVPTGFTNPVPTGIQNGRVIGNGSSGATNHGFYDSVDVGANVRVNAINQNLSIVGTKLVGSADHAFVADITNFNTVNEQPGLQKDLGTLGGTNSFGLAINPLSDEVVGEAQNAAGVFHAFFDMPNQPMVDLNSLLNPILQSQWTLTEATTIDGQGDIGGIGLLNGVQHAFFLTLGTVITNVTSPLTISAPSRVLQKSIISPTIVPVTATVVIPTASPTSPVSFTLNAVTPTTFLNTPPSQANGVAFSPLAPLIFGAQVNLTNSTAASFTGTIKFTSAALGITNQAVNYTVQIVDPAIIQQSTNFGLGSNQIGVTLTKLADPNPIRQSADAEVASAPVLPAGWTQIGNALASGAAITASSPLSANFSFNTTNAANGVHTGSVSFFLQNDHTVSGATPQDLGRFSEQLSFLVNNAALPTGSSYTGLNNVSPAGTIATLIGGSVGNNPGAAAGAGNGSPTINLTANSNPAIDSDIVTLSGTNGDIVVLQVSFNPNGDTNPNDFALMYDPAGDNFAVNSSSELAVQANTSPPTNQIERFNRAYNAATDFVLGFYGVDLTNDVAWAVIDHNSEFAVGAPPAVVPEPASVHSLSSIAALAMLRRRRK